ncbi:MAG: hypothetical protein Q7L55_09740 [Actinomycetota bacterium]|nr:hypothetical protein [Actinomycetota bacterium]
MKLFRRHKRRWSVVTSAPAGSAGEQWGDTWFARDLVAALNEQGQNAKVIARNRAHAQERSDDEIVVVLRGLNEITPRKGPGALWLLWVISHPELVSEQEAAGYDTVFAASKHWQPGFVDAVPLLQATNPRRFTPSAAAPDSGEELLFVGSTRGQFRPVVRDALAAELPLSLYGVGWQEYVGTDRISGDFLANDRLPAAYAGAQVVLNDHHPDMAELGFLSNRLFDATATATRVISDRALGLEEVFDGFVHTYASASELHSLFTDRDAAFPPYEARLEFARTIAQEHSFSARASALIAHAEQLRNLR